MAEGGPTDCGNGRTSGLDDRLELIAVRLLVIADRCNEATIEWELREIANQLVEIVSGVADRTTGA